MTKPAQLSFVLILLFTVNTKTTVAQNADCFTATELPLDQLYTSKQAPSGFGLIKEFENNDKQSEYFFENEHHSAWYYFTVPYDGVVTFEITPEQVKDDYDWLLYKSSGAFVCDDILNQGILPVRTNISRNDRSNLSKTGLKEGFENEFTSAGIHFSYSMPLEVKQGEQYYLVLDNVYDGGMGHSIYLHIEKTKKAWVKGKVTGRETEKPVASEIIIEEDETGEYLTSIFTDTSGRYSIELPLDNYNFTVYKKDYLYASENVNLIAKKDQEQVLYDFEIDTFRYGKTMTFFNINFDANSTQVLPNSQGDLARLTTFMKKYPHAVIEIQGHTNYNPFTDRSYLFNLSFERSKEIKKYLVQQGIPADRINCSGMGGSTPLVVTDDREKAMRNLRVEIVLVDKLN